MAAVEVFRVLSNYLLLPQLTYRWVQLVSLYQQPNRYQLCITLFNNLNKKIL